MNNSINLFGVNFDVTNYVNEAQQVIQRDRQRFDNMLNTVNRVMPIALAAIAAIATMPVWGCLLWDILQ